MQSLFWERHDCVSVEDQLYLLKVGFGVGLMPGAVQAFLHPPTHRTQSQSRGLRTEWGFSAPFAQGTQIVAR